MSVFDIKVIFKEAVKENVGVNAEFFADSDKIVKIDKKLPWGFRPRQS